MERVKCRILNLATNESPKRRCSEKSDGFLSSRNAKRAAEFRLDGAF